ncbi:MAG: Flp pilus assembly protein CpaB [Micrococcales bacterium]|nr:Flp pilus assembly protein CpaB [Micrococcales bacterium]
MNPRQKRGVAMLVLTALGAIAVFVSVLVYVGDINSQVGNRVMVLQLTKDLEAFEPVTASSYKFVEVPERWTTSTTLREEKDVVGLVAATALPKGSVLQLGMVITRPGVQPGYREIAIMVDAETGVAGKVKPGDHVDIIATTAGTRASSGQAEVSACSEVWVSNALVLEVGMVTESDDGSGFGMSRGVPMTFALKNEDVLRVAYIESFSVKLRLALRGAGDATGLSVGDNFCEGIGLSMGGELAQEIPDEPEEPEDPPPGTEPEGEPPAGEG